MLKSFLYKLFFVSLLAFGARSCLFEPFKVVGNAMYPAVVSGDLIGVSKTRYGLRVPGPGDMIVEWSDVRRGDLVIVSILLDQQTTLLRRVVGLPEETVLVQNGRVIITAKNGRDVWNVPCDDVGVANYCREKYENKSAIVRLNNDPKSLMKMEAPRTLDPDEFFVLADDRRDGPDSRRFGPIKIRHIVGKASFLLSGTDLQKSNSNLDKTLVRQSERKFFGALQ